MKAGLHIVALGARTPVGLSAESSAAAVRARIGRIVLHPFMADHENENVRGAIDGAFDAGILGWSRFAALAGFALDEVMQKLGSRLPNEPTSVLLALPEPRPGFEATDERLLIAELEAAQGRTGRQVQIKISGRGHAGGLEAIADAATQIRSGRNDLFVIGGVDSYFDFDTLDWLQEHRQLMTEETRGGFCPGEGAGFVALASERARRQLQLDSLGVLRGWGTAKEKKLIKTDDVNLGEGLAQALAAAVDGLPSGAGATDVYCDINGERYRSEEWGLALLRVPGAAVTHQYVAPVDSWGDVGAASGPLLCSLAVRAWARGYAAGSRALIWASSEAGSRAALLIDAPAGG